MINEAIIKEFREKFVKDLLMDFYGEPSILAKEIESFWLQKLEEERKRLLQEIEDKYGNMNDDPAFIIINTVDWMRIKKDYGREE